MQRPLLVLKPALFFTYLLFDRRLGLAETKTRQTFVWIIAENELRMCTRSEACADSYLPRDRQHRSAIPTMRDAGNEPAQVFFFFLCVWYVLHIVSASGTQLFGRVLSDHVDNLIFVKPWASFAASLLFNESIRKSCLA